MAQREQAECTRRVGGSPGAAAAVPELRDPPVPAIQRWLIATTMFAGTVLLFLPSLSYDFVNYDDPRYLTSNPHVQQGLTWAGVRWVFTHNADYWHPLTWVSHLLDWQLFGSNAAGHHLTSVLWHALNAVLLLLILCRFTGRFWASALAAAVFAWHPLRVESVTWITERKDVMSGAFLLLTVAAYGAYARRRLAGGRGTIAYGLALLAFAFGLMCKPSLVTLPLGLLALDAWPLRRAPGGRAGGSAWRSLAAEKVPFLVLSAATGVVTLRMQQEAGAFTLDLPLAARLANVPVAIMRYLGKFFWPADLAVCYPHPGWWPAWLGATAVLLCAGLTFAAWRQRRAAPWLLAGWAWFIIMLLPMAGIVQVGFQSMADRYTYVPMIGWTVALLWSLAHWTPSTRAITGTVALLLCAALGARTWTQQATWRDSETLFRHAVAVTERNAVAEAFLAHTLAAAGSLDEAARHAARALQIDPRSEMAVLTLADIEARRGRFAAAVEGYRRALELRPGESTTEYALALLLLRAGDPKAEPLLRKVVGVAPTAFGATLRQAEAELLRGQPDEAALRYTAATLMNPGSAPAYAGLGYAHVRAGRTAEASAAFRRAIELAPRDAGIQRAWAETLARRGRFADAVDAYRRAVQLDPDDAASHAGLGFVLYLTSQRSEAVRSWKEALRLDPAFPGLRERLAKLEGSDHP